MVRGGASRDTRLGIGKSPGESDQTSSGQLAHWHASAGFRAARSHSSACALKRRAGNRPLRNRGYWSGGGFLPGKHSSKSSQHSRALCRVHCAGCSLLEASLVRGVCGETIRSAQCIGETAMWSVRQPQQRPPFQIKGRSGYLDVRPTGPTGSHPVTAHPCATDRLYELSDRASRSSKRTSGLANH